MSRDQKCKLASELNRAFGIDLFDEEGFLEEDRFDKFLAIVRQYVAV